MPAPDLGGPIAAMTQYGTDLEAFVRAEMQETVNAAHAETETLRAEFEAYKVSHPDVTPPPPTTPKKIIGMSSPATEWATRVREVGSNGLGARRIFAFLSTDEQLDLVKAAHDAGLMPVYSFKISGLTASNLGTYDAKVAALTDKLDAFGKPTTVTFHHEPSPDIPGSLFVAANERFAAIVQARRNLKFGPLLNGWLLDNQPDTFASYTSTKLLDSWDFVGIDTYEAGTLDAPGARKPAERIPKLVKWLTDRGHGDKPLIVGEYNGYSAETIAACGEAILSIPTVWVGCFWNSTGGKGYVLTGDRLEAFKRTKSDSRVQQ